MTKATIGSTDDFKKIIATTQKHQFDNSILNSVVFSGILQKSSEPENFVLVKSKGTASEQIIEMKTKDVIKYERTSSDDKEPTVVKVFVKPETIIVQKTQSMAKLYSARFGDTRPTGLPDWVNWRPWDEILGDIRDRVDFYPESQPPPPLTPHQEQCWERFREGISWLAEESRRRHKEIEDWIWRVSNSLRNQRDRCLSSNPGDLVQI